VATKVEPIAWDRVLVRHVLPGKRQDASHISPLVRVPFDALPMTSDAGNRDDALIGVPMGRWVIAARFAKESWAPLFSNAASAEGLFNVNAGSRRLEVAWIGCQPQGAGWFIRVHRAGQPIIEFAQRAEIGSARTFRDVETSPVSLDDCATGEQAFRRICDSLEITLPIREIRATGRAFQMFNGRGKPVKSGLRGYVHFHGSELSVGESAAADGLAAAIDDCDADGIRDAISQGASRTTLPGTSVSPLLKALLRYGACDLNRWKACLDALLANGCPIDGPPGGNPPIVGCVDIHIPDRATMKMIEFLVARGANVNAQHFDGMTALFAAAIEGDVRLVRFLLRHGADPKIGTNYGVSMTDWLKGSLRAWSEHAVEKEEIARHREILDLVTNFSIE
jgi:Ankyrin repeats (many copies)